MDFKGLEPAIEAVIFSSGDEISIDTLCKIFEVDKKILTTVMSDLMSDYNSQKRGIQIIQMEDKYQMCTRPEFYEYIKKLYEPRVRTGLSQAALETLSIVAYKQPITKAHIDEIRGVGSETSLGKLIEKNLIKEVGRVDAPGRPILYGTTDEFLRSFGFKSIKELPIIDGLGTI